METSHTFNRDCRDGGLTLLELLVAFSLLALLTGLLVMLFRDGVTIWNRGESRRLVYENAHFLFSRMQKDIGQMWAPIDRRADTDQNNPYPRPAIYSSVTPDGNRWLEFLKMKSGFVTNQSAGSIMDRMTRVVYLMDLEKGLLRAEFSSSMVPPHIANPDLLDDDTYLLKKGFELVARDIIYTDFKFWGPWTDNWDSEGPYGRGDGPAIFWDSSRQRMSQFRMNSSKRNPLPAVPKMVRVRVEVREAGKTDWPRIRGGVEEDETLKQLEVTNYEQLPESGFVRIDDEWIYYGDRDEGVLKELIRGVRGTSKMKHDTNAEVLYGHQFENTFEISIYPGRNYYLP